MPHLIFRGVSVEQVKSISKPLVQELAELCNCGTDNFTLEVFTNTFVFDGEVIPGYPLIEVKWFERGQNIQDQFAKVVTKHVQLLDFQDIEVAFSTFLESAYYCDGKSFASS